MDIGDAFTQEAIANAGTDVGSEEEEAELRQTVGQVYRAISPTIPEGGDVVAEVGMLSFIAGRTYEQQFGEGDGWADPNHALAAGMVLGVLMKHGVDAVPEMDGTDYTNVVVVRYEGREIRMRVLP